MMDCRIPVTIASGTFSPGPSTNANEVVDRLSDGQIYTQTSYPRGNPARTTATATNP